MIFVRQLRSFRVEGLFHAVTHKIEFSANSPVTILAGPNGVGKTHILRLIRAMLAAEANEIASITFETAEIGFTDGRTLTVERGVGDDGISLVFQGRGPKGGDIGRFLLSDIGEFVDDFPERFRPMHDGRIKDRRTGRIMTRMQFQRNFGHLGSFSDAALKIAPWLTQFVSGNRPIFIDTKRLDTPRPPAEPTFEAAKNIAGARIDQYIDEVRVQVGDARRASLAESQRADQSFAARVLEGSKSIMRKDELKLKFDQISALNAELSRNGLSSPSVAVQFPASGITPTQRRVLSVFVEDWEGKIRPLLPVNEKLKTLRRIINEKFIGKTLELDSTGGLHFVTEERDEIPVRYLSSGEQHILALFTMLLFSAARGSVVLIDEPEISLHAAWKHSFLGDITDVAGIADLQVVFATHSSGIINGEWDLVQELGIQR